MRQNMMHKHFTEMLKNGEKALITYFPVGDPVLKDGDVDGAKRYFANGTTVLEIGLPYENPVLDGETVRSSMERALTVTDAAGAFDRIAAIRKACPDNILQIMCYHELVDRFGEPEFARRCNDAGVDAVLTPNATVAELERLDAALGEYGILNLRFIPYHLTEDRINDLKANASGYVFLQAVNGATGSGAPDIEHMKENIHTLREIGIDALLCPGFGISKPEEFRQMIEIGADGVIIGSAVLKHLQAGDAESYIHELRSVHK